VPGGDDAPQCAEHLDVDELRSVEVEVVGLQRGRDGLARRAPE
jgi:hypothetical protein